MPADHRVPTLEVARRGMPVTVRVRWAMQASTAGSRRLYERHGFDVIGVCQMAKDAPPLYRMGRPPQVQPAADQAAGAT